MYEFFEHTADIGLRVRSADLGALMAEAAKALFSLIVTNLDAVRPLAREDFHVDAEPPEDLLHDWLADLLVSFDTRHLVFSRFDCQLDQNGLAATAWGEPLDPARHRLGMEVKAITYHGLKVQRDPDAWLGEVILDI